MEEKTLDLLRRQGCNRSCCGRCVHWHTYVECRGEKYGWWGVCNCPENSVGEIEADDYCRHFEEEKQAEVK